MKDVYKDLAQKLDGLPQGYPATESGIELKILQKIYSPEEAEMALKIRPIPETAEAISQRLGKPVPEMEAILDDMVGKGQIGSFKHQGRQMYMFFPFVIGVYEFQLDRMDKELTELFEEYAPVLLKEFGGHAPAAARVVPISKDVGADLLVHRHDDIRGMLEEAKSFKVLDCICRKEQELEGHPCKYTVEVCLGFSNEEEAFEKDPRGRVVSREEAFAVLDKAEEEGLVHCTYNVQDGQAFVCNCCPCCCGILRGVKEYNAPYILAKSNFVALIDQDELRSVRRLRGRAVPHGSDRGRRRRLQGATREMHRVRRLCFHLPIRRDPARPETRLRAGHAAGRPGGLDDEASRHPRGAAQVGLVDFSRPAVSVMPRQLCDPRGKGS